ncbi:DUF2780 domain-containing protein [Ferrimonas pelagia]
MQRKQGLALIAGMMLCGNAVADNWLTDLFGGDEPEKDAVTEVVSESTAPVSDGLVGTLVSQLGVSEDQASGGAGALLSLAQSSLGGSDWGQLTELLPEAAGLASGVDLSALAGDGGGLGDLAGMLGGEGGSSMLQVAQAFSGLGLDASSISQFAPVILEYLQGQGGADLVDKLSSLWSL